MFQWCGGYSHKSFNFVTICLNRDSGMAVKRRKYCIGDVYILPVFLYCTVYRIAALYRISASIFWL